MKIEISKQEAEAMIQLFDIAIKSQGIQVAETAIFLTKKLQDGFREEEKQHKPKK